MNFPGKLISAGEIWKKDKQKKELAEKYSYRILYLWEQDLNLMSEDELNLFLLKSIGESNESGKGQKDSED